MPFTVKKSRAIRARLLHDTDGRCWYCGMRFASLSQVTIDHFVPQSMGGTDELDNLVPACKRCNSAKCNGPLDELRESMRIWNAGWPVRFSKRQVWFLENVLGLDLGLGEMPEFWGEQIARRRSL